MFYNKVNWKQYDNNTIAKGSCDSTQMLQQYRTVSQWTTERAVWRWPRYTKLSTELDHTITLDCYHLNVVIVCCVVWSAYWALMNNLSWLSSRWVASMRKDDWPYVVTEAIIFRGLYCSPCFNCFYHWKPIRLQTTLFERWIKHGSCLAHSSWSSSKQCYCLICSLLESESRRKPNTW